MSNILPFISNFSCAAKIIESRGIHLPDTENALRNRKILSITLLIFDKQTRFSYQFEQGLSKIKEAFGRKSGVKKLEKVWEGISRRTTKYPSINKYFETIFQQWKW